MSSMEKIIKREAICKVELLEPEMELEDISSEEMECYETEEEEPEQEESLIIAEDDGNLEQDQAAEDEEQEEPEGEEQEQEQEIEEDEETADVDNEFEQVNIDEEGDVLDVEEGQEDQEVEGLDLVEEIGHLIEEAEEDQEVFEELEAATTEDEEEEGFEQIFNDISLDVNEEQIIKIEVDDEPTDYNNEGQPIIIASKTIKRSQTCSPSLFETSDEKRRKKSVENADPLYYSSESDLTGVELDVEKEQIIETEMLDNNGDKILDKNDADPLGLGSIDDDNSNKSINNAVNFAENLSEPENESSRLTENKSANKIMGKIKRTNSIQISNSNNNNSSCDQTEDECEEKPKTDENTKIVKKSSKNSQIDSSDKDISDKEIWYLCRICWKGFLHVVSLVQHKIRVHNFNYRKMEGSDENNSDQDDGSGAHLTPDPLSDPDMDKDLDRISEIKVEHEEEIVKEEKKPKILLRPSFTQAQRSLRIASTSTPTVEVTTRSRLRSRSRPFSRSNARLRHKGNVTTKSNGVSSSSSSSSTGVTTTKSQTKSRSKPSLSTFLSKAMSMARPKLKLNSNSGSFSRSSGNFAGTSQRGSHTCPFCHLEFAKGPLLRAHMRSSCSHRKVYQCPICDTRFCYNANMYRHIRNNHKEVSEEEISMIKYRPERHSPDD